MYLHLIFAAVGITRTTMAPQITTITMVVPTMEAVTITIIIEVTFILEPTTIVSDPAMVAKIMDTMAVASSTINTGNLEVFLEEAKSLLLLEQALAFWVGQWQVWQPCQCIIDTECTPV